jgi:hypothetical protein
MTLQGSHHIRGFVMPRSNVSSPTWAKPGITVLSVAAITTIGFAVPAEASATHRPPVPQTSTYRAIVAAIHGASGRTMSARDISTFSGIPPIPGNGEQATPSFGAGKEVVYVEPKAGTFPAGMTPDLSKVTFDFHQTMTDGTDTQVVAVHCDNDSSGPADPLTPCANLDAPLQLDQPFTIVFDSADSTLPSGFVGPADVTDTVASTLPVIGLPISTSNFAPRALGTPPPTGCIDIPIQPSVKFCNKSITVQVPGTWRPVGLDLTNKVTGAPLAHSKFALSQGSTTLGSATTDSKGHLTFPGIYQGGSFTLTQKSSPAGYAALGEPLAIKVPAVTTAAAAGQEYDVHVKLLPLPPTAADDTTSTAQDKSTVVQVLANDTAVSAPLAISAVGKPGHGKAVANPDGTITYTPAAGYSGSDTFTYAVRNGLGGTDSASVIVTIVHSQVLGDRLAMTGQASWLEADLGLGSVLVGGLLVAAGRRRRNVSR